jgi:hypothetical protein
MKKLFIAILLAWTVVYLLDNSWPHHVHLHLDWDDQHWNMAEWLIGGLVVGIVFIVLATVLATGILALFFVVAIVAVFAMLLAGFSAVWPILIGVALYYVCRDKPNTDQIV